jgi:hypothetical protein
MAGTMNNLEKIEVLIEKYYRGETTVREENELRDFFRNGDVPDRLKTEAGIFGFFYSEAETPLPGDLESRLGSMGPVTRRPGRIPGRNLRTYLVSGIAAAILVLIGIFVDMRIREAGPLEVKTDTYEDPYLAYAEAKKVLYLVSEKLNTGREPLKKLEKLDAGVNYMHPVLSFGTGIQHLGHLSTIQETKELISKD